MSQQIFNPINYFFNWSNDWYQWNSKKAHEEAKRLRDKEAKRLKEEEGFKVKKFTIKNQLITRGGIGSGKPEISEIVTCYCLDYPYPF